MAAVDGQIIILSFLRVGGGRVIFLALPRVARNRRTQTRREDGLTTRKWSKTAATSLLPGHRYDRSTIISIVNNAGT